MPIVFSPAFINLLGFKVNNIEHNVSINFGPSSQIDLTSFTRANTGSGSSFGDFAFYPIGVSTVIDPDVLDTPEVKSGIL